MEAGWLRRMEREEENAEIGFSADSLWMRTVALFLRSDYARSYSEEDRLEQEREGISWFLGRVRRRAHLFLAGDLVIGVWSNGGGSRQPVWSRTSRGYDVCHYYMPYARSPEEYVGERRSYRWRQKHLMPKWQAWVGKNEPRRLAFQPRKPESERCLLEVLELPGELAIKSPADSAVREYVLGTLSAGDAARPVGAGSRVLSSTDGGAT